VANINASTWDRRYFAYAEHDTAQTLDAVDAARATLEE